jgi:hypothetical protein
VYVFGLSYAVASLSCTLPIFLVVVAGTIPQLGFVSGVLTFLVYGLGMSMLLVVVTLALAFGKRPGRLVATLVAARQPRQRRILVVAGAYIVWFWATTLASGGLEQSGAVVAVERMSSTGDQPPRRSGDERRRRAGPGHRGRGALRLGRHPPHRSQEQGHVSQRRSPVGRPPSVNFRGMAMRPRGLPRQRALRAVTAVTTPGRSWHSRSRRPRSNVARRRELSGNAATRVRPSSEGWSVCVVPAWRR